MIMHRNSTTDSKSSNKHDEQVHRKIPGTVERSSATLDDNFKDKSHFYAVNIFVSQVTTSAITGRFLGVIIHLGWVWKKNV